MTETESEKTPLQQKLDEFGQQLSKASQPLSGVSLSSLILLHFFCVQRYVNYLQRSFSKDCFQRIDIIILSVCLSVCL